MRDRLLRLTIKFASALVLASGVLLAHAPAAVAATGCTQPTTDYGTITESVSIPGTGSYKIWTRMAAADTTNNTYLLDIDSSSCSTIGGSSVPVYTSAQDTAGNRFVSGSSNWIAAPSMVTLSSGTHTLKLIGNAPNVVVDRLILTQDTTCTPTGTGDDCVGTTDTTAPVVSISSPGSGSTITSSSSNITVHVTDDSGAVSKTELYDGASLIATNTTTTSGDVNFIGVSLATGPHTLTAKAYDAAGNIGISSSVSITVDYTAPTISISAPASGTTQSGQITVSANASDNVGVSKVQFFIDGQQFGSNVTSSPYSVNLNTASYSNGSHSLTAKAYDAAGNTKTSSSVSITVSNSSGGTDTTPPTASFTAPTANEAIAGSAYQVTALASDSSGIKQVIIKVDGTTKSTLTSAPYTYSLNTTGMTSGSHTVSAVVTDNSAAQNAVTISVTVRVTSLMDVSRNCVVNYSDISPVVAKIGATGSQAGIYDVNLDGRVNYSDVSAVVTKIGTTPC